VKLAGLYAITPEGLDEGTLLERAAQALEGGAVLLQYRAKRADAARRGREARALHALCRARGVPFLVNDDVTLALEVGADGAHLGRDDGALAAARARLRGKILGASCYDRLELAQAAVAAGADYVAFGSVYPSSTKPGAVRAPLELFCAARALGVPRAAIGGITVGNAPALVHAGAELLAVITDLFDAPDIAARARAYRALFAQPAATQT
jgi:thiamine-phosphate pyrophosphorylase